MEKFATKKLKSSRMSDNLDLNLHWSPVFRERSRQRFVASLISNSLVIDTTQTIDKAVDYIKKSLKIPNG